MTTADNGSNGGNPVAAELSAVLAIGGMHCGGCAARVKEALLAVPGVNSAEVSLVKGTAVVGYDPDKASVGALSAAVKDAGYSASAASAGE